MPIDLMNSIRRRNIFAPQNRPSQSRPSQSPARRAAPIFRDQQPSPFMQRPDPSMQRRTSSINDYRRHISSMPERANYAPGFLGKLSAAFIGAGEGIRSKSPMQGYLSARQVRETPYLNALQQWQDRGFGKAELANLDYQELELANKYYLDIIEENRLRETAASQAKLRGAQAKDLEEKEGRAESASDRRQAGEQALERIRQIGREGLFGEQQAGRMDVVGAQQAGATERRRESDVAAGKRNKERIDAQFERAQIAASRVNSLELDRVAIDRIRRVIEGGPDGQYADWFNFAETEGNGFKVVPPKRSRNVPFLGASGEELEANYRSELLKFDKFLEWFNPSRPGSDMPDLGRRTDPSGEDPSTGAQEMIDSGELQRLFDAGDIDTIDPAIRQELIRMGILSVI